MKLISTTNTRITRLKVRSPLITAYFLRLYFVIIVVVNHIFFNQVKKAMILHFIRMRMPIKDLKNSNALKIIFFFPFNLFNGASIL